MHFDKVDLNLFVIFDAIYREQSVTRVAQQLNLTQPAVSNSLARLRRGFDDQLFIRTPQGMQPTPVADSVIGDVRRALGLLRDSMGVNARFEPSTSEKVFRLGMNDLSQLLVLPGVIDVIKKQAPSAGISCFYLDRQQAVEDLKSGALELLLDVPEVNARDLGHQQLAKLPYVVAMRPGHRLARKKLDLDAYLGEEHVNVSSRRRGRGHTDVALHALGKQRRTVARVQHYTVAAGITAESELLWTVPRVMAARTDLMVKELPFSVEPLELNLYWARNATVDPANLWLRQLVTEQFNEKLSIDSRKRA